MRHTAILALMIACGDNRHPLDDSGFDAFECVPTAGARVTLRQIVYGCGSPGAPAAPDCINDAIVLATSPPADPRLFVVERRGVIQIVDREHLVRTPFLDLSEDAAGPTLTDGGELGLLGLAFHPQYATNHQLFVYYTTRNPDASDPGHPLLDVVARYTTEAPDRADPRSGVVVLAIPDPYGNHNGGMIEFGNDGDLYISTGDGGSGGDPMGNAQNPSSLLGKMLRVDVDHPDPGLPYGIPTDNPFAQGGGAKEVFMLGLRNPWRWSFDPPTGDMWIGDVGQALYEELDVLRANEQVGKNLGWNMWEAASCYNPPCDPTGMTFPVDIREHAPGWVAIIGGQVYRGACYPDLVGSYFYSDCGAGYLVQARLQSDGSLDKVDWLSTTIVYPAGIHAGPRGELYESTVGGDVYHIEAGP